MNPLTLDNVNWQDFYLTDFFRLEKGNQNNMAILQDGNLPLVSAKKTDNGYKQFIAPNGKRLYDGNILTLNNDGDGGAGIAYYQPFQMALDSHCTALIPKKEMSRFQMLFIALCITKQRDRFGHGYSLNNSRLRSFKFMLPVNADNQPDWDFMEAYMRKQEKQILQPTIKQLCNQLIYSELVGGGVKSSSLILIGKNFILRKSSPIYNVANVSKKPTTMTAIRPMFPQLHKTMEWTVLSEMKAA